MRKQFRSPRGGFAFGLALNAACCLPGAMYYASILIGVGWFFGAVWSLLDFGRSAHHRDLRGLAFAAAGMILDFTPSLWLAHR